ncbi:bcl-2-like protein 1 [Parasteatoda tepidariorum]|uniref:bcl-2-like protein 1 n=1 Tax=Parasteatoda tepidariorum TaxID=114398 RepID=UPI0039BD7C9E
MHHQPTTINSNVRALLLASVVTLQKWCRDNVPSTILVEAGVQNVLLRHIGNDLRNIANDFESLVAGGQNVLLHSIGRDLRSIANDFADSPQRGQIKQCANLVDLEASTFEGFWALLEEVFRHGINVYNIVALFYFCSDILIRSVKMELARIGTNLFRWALLYISEQVCRWVYENGGWEKAIKQVVRGRNNAYVALRVLGVVVVVWGIYKGIKKLK